MNLAKQCVDVAMFTNRPDVVSFWRDDVGLRLDEILSAAGTTSIAST